MATKTDFTAEEWELLREAPQWAALAVTVAGASGLFGTLQEAFGVTGALVEGMRGGNELIRQVCDREEVVAAQRAVREQIRDLPQDDLDNLKTQIGARATAKVAAALAVLERKATADLPEYREFLRRLADRVANAAKEGGFLGFGGERVSAGEREMIARLGTVLGPAT